METHGEEEEGGVEELAAEDEARLQRERMLGSRICEMYGDSLTGSGLASLDTVLERWRIDSQETKPPVIDVAPGLGCLFGDELCAGCSCRWMVTTDALGRHLRIIHEPTGMHVDPYRSLICQINSGECDTNSMQRLGEAFSA